MTRDTVLPAELRPVVSTGLIRLGGGEDGGYLVAADSVACTRTLYGFGVGFDWRFEKDFARLAHSDLAITCFDHTMTWNAWIKRLIQARHQGIRGIARHLFNIYDYRRFFGKRAIHRKEMIAPGAMGGVTPASLLGAGERDVFLRIDIEGWEYRILEQLISHANRLTGTVIEFHDCDLHMDRILDFVRRFPLSLCHIHGNNWGAVAENGIPISMELTFKAPSVNDAPFTGELPCAIDRPNNPAKPDYRLTFIG